MRRILSLLFATLLIVSCGGGAAKRTTVKENVEKPVIVPVFNADSAYSFVEAQVAFGPRVPNSAEHRACADWLEAKLRSYGAEVIVQNIELTAYTGERLDAHNIIAQFQPQKRKRVRINQRQTTAEIASATAKMRITSSVSSSESGLPFAAIIEDT